MPLLLDDAPAATKSSDTTTIEIGLLNNLSDAGLEGCDRQFVEILREAAGTRMVRLRFFSMPSIPRGTVGRKHIAARYTNFAALKDMQLDGVIVTGCEPRTRRLPDEPFWPQLTEVIDWAEHNTRSTIWSCLSAHAAVLHLDGIERRPLATKRTGLFDVERVETSRLLDGSVGAFRVPHSRWNGLDSDDLVAAGYKILTQGPDVGVDAFVKGWRSLFVYLQGHPEYDADALRREYRRDVMRYLEGTSDTYPTLPSNYFDPGTETRLRAFEACAQGKREPRLALAFPLERRGKPWRREFATILFGNWLDLLQAKATDHAA